MATVLPSELKMDPNFRNLSPDLRREAIVGNPQMIGQVDTVQTINGGLYVTVEHGSAR